MVATSHLWLLSAWNVASGTEEIKFKFHLILINLNSFTELVATVLDSAALKH